MQWVCTHDCPEFCVAFCVLLVTLHLEVSNEIPEEVVASEGLSVPDPDPDREAVYSSLAFLHVPE